MKEKLERGYEKIFCLRNKYVGAMQADVHLKPFKTALTLTISRLQMCEGRSIQALHSS